MKPKRIQRKRTKGWKMPPNTIYVGRPSKWGNHYRVGDNIFYYGLIKDNEMATGLYKEWVEGNGLQEEQLDILELKGKNLACWCKLCPKHQNGKHYDIKCSDCQPCHADVLLEVANG